MKTYPANYPILRVRGLRKLFPVGRGQKLHAIDGVDFDLHPGRTLALVGESGSGKSTVARCLVRLIEPTEGEVVLHGNDVGRLDARQLSGMYRSLQMVFQDPNASLNPRMTVRQVLDEPLRLHLSLSAADRAARISELLRLVGLGDEHLGRYPHELSGGQRQRIGIARAISINPEVVLLDEPTASLDVSVRGQVLELLREIQRELNLAYLFISHDLQVVRHVADDVAVMYLGKIVEQGPVREIFEHPRHPYTRALMSAAPVARWGAKRERVRLAGEISTPIDPPAACRLALSMPAASWRRVGSSRWRSWQRCQDAAIFERAAACPEATAARTRSACAVCIRPSPMRAALAACFRGRTHFPGPDWKSDKCPVRPMSQAGQAVSEGGRGAGGRGAAAGLDPLAGGDVEEVQRVLVWEEPQLGPELCGGGQGGDQFLAVDLAMDQPLRAKLLDIEDLHRRGAGAPGLGGTQAFRADAQDRGPVGRARELDLGIAEHRLPAADSRVDQVHRGRADEAGDEGRGRAVVELQRLADLLHLAAVQHDQPVGQRHRLELVMGDIDRSGAEPVLQLLDLAAHLHAQLGVEI